MNKKNTFVLMTTALTMLSSVVLAGESDHGSHMTKSSSEKSNDDMSMDGMNGMDVGRDHKMSKSSHGSHKTMKPMSMSKARAQGGSAPENARDPHANSGGYKRDPLRRLVLADEYTFYKVMVNRLEVTRSEGVTAQVFDMQAWYGYDYNRLVFKSEGDISGNSLEEASTELLWGHAVATFWDAQLGLRYDNGEGKNRSWLAMGMQGLAPYWFELDTTFYIADDLNTSFSLEAEYELLITQKLILQPRLETTLYGKSDAARGLGSGLSDASFGIRLRYEFKREIATYVGVEWQSKFGGTADMAKKANIATSDKIAVAGLRIWF